MFPVHPFTRTCCLPPCVCSQHFGKMVFPRSVSEASAVLSVCLVHSFCHLWPTRRSCLKLVVYFLQRHLQSSLFFPPGYNIMVVHYRKFSKYHKHSPPWILWFLGLATVSSVRTLFLFCAQERVCIWLSVSPIIFNLFFPCLNIECWHITMPLKILLPQWLSIFFFFF